MKHLGAVLLTLGFLAGAYFSVAQVATVDWKLYGVCLGLMVFGMIFLRMAAGAALEQAGDKHASDIAVLQQSLSSLIDKVRGFESRSSDEDQLTVHQRIDDELMDDINTFVDARESMIPKLGMQRYANVMSPFANGERLLNRAWSASADGYVDEVRSCIAGARAELEKAQALLGG